MCFSDIEQITSGLSSNRHWIMSRTAVNASGKQEGFDGRTELQHACLPCVSFGISSNFMSASHLLVANC